MSKVDVNRDNYTGTEEVPKPVQYASKFGEHARIVTESAIRRYNKLVGRLSPEEQEMFPNPNKLSYQELLQYSGNLSRHVRINYPDNPEMKLLGEGIMLDTSCACRLKKY